MAGRKSVARQLESMRQLPRPSDVEFGPMNDLAEMARIASSYTTRLSPEQVRLTRVGRFIWLRLDAGSEFRSNTRPNTRTRPRSVTTNLIFRLAVDSAKSIPVTLAFRDLHAATPPQTT